VAIVDKRRAIERFAALLPGTDKTIYRRPIAEADAPSMPRDTQRVSDCSSVITIGDPRAKIRGCASIAQPPQMIPGGKLRQ
jgi:hypothetical protein